MYKYSFCYRRHTFSYEFTFRHPYIVLLPPLMFIALKKNFIAVYQECNIYPIKDQETPQGHQQIFLNTVRRSHNRRRINLFQNTNVWMFRENGRYTKLWINEQQYKTNIQNKTMPDAPKLVKRKKKNCIVIF